MKEKNFSYDENNIKSNPNIKYRKCRETTLLTFAHASMRAVVPKMSVVSSSVPLAKSMATTLVLPNTQACIKAVSPASFFSSRLGPANSLRSISGKLPFWTHERKQNS